MFYIILLHALLSLHIKLTVKLVADRPTDNPTEQPTNIVTYEAAIATKKVQYYNRIEQYISGNISVLAILVLAILLLVLVK